MMFVYNGVDKIRKLWITLKNGAFLSFFKKYNKEKREKIIYFI